MNGHPFAQIPWWMMMGPPGNNQQQPHPVVPDIIVPARVNKAMDFISLLTHKTATRAAGNDLSIELIEGQKLTDEEQNALASACNLLSNYFAGRLNPDVWEAIKVEGARKQVEQVGGSGRLLHCLGCQGGPPRPGCMLCDGTGRIMVTPMGSPGCTGSGPMDDDDDDDREPSRKER